MRLGLVTFLCASCVLPVDIREGEPESRNRPPVIGSIDPASRETCCLDDFLGECTARFRVNAVSDEDTDQALALRWFVYSVDMPTTPGPPVLTETIFEADPNTGQRAAPTDELRIAELATEIVLTEGLWVVEAVLSDGFAYDAPVSDDGEPQDMRAALPGFATARETWILTLGDADQCP